MEKKMKNCLKLRIFYEISGKKECYVNKGDKKEPETIFLIGSEGFRDFN